MPVRGRRLHMEPFTLDEIREITAYLCSECNPATHMECGARTSANAKPVLLCDMDPAAYCRLIERFVAVLNRRPEGRSRELRLARACVWRLYQDRALPRCQMTAMCAYVGLCATIPEIQAGYASFLETTSASNKHLGNVLEHVEESRRALDREAIATKILFGDLSIDWERHQTLTLLSNCLRHSYARDNASHTLVSVRAHSTLYSDLVRTYRAAILAPPHQLRQHATASEAETILRILHEALTGEAPSIGAAKYYRAQNTMRDKSRYRRSKSTLDGLLEGPDRIKMSPQIQIALTKTLLEAMCLTPREPPKI